MLERLLTELRDKIDDDYCQRIDTAPMKSVDDLHERAIERMNTIDAVIQWARSYELDGSAKLDAAEALATVAEKAENAILALQDSQGDDYDYPSPPLSELIAHAGAAQRELSAALRQFREATK